MFENVNKNEIEEIVTLVEELAEYYDGDNWLVFKKYVLRYSKPETRKNFSTRDSKTKKHHLNKFEIELIKFCKTSYNLNLILYPEDKHT